MSSPLEQTRRHTGAQYHIHAPCAKVDLDEAGCYLADVGFAGTNSIAPVALGSDTPQELPEGQFRVVGGTHPRYSQLQLLIGEWRGLYEWRDERAAACDMERELVLLHLPPRASRHRSLLCRVIDGERHHILNADYVVRKGHGVESTVETRQIGGKAELLQLLKEVFGINLDGVVTLVLIGTLPLDPENRDRQCTCSPKEVPSFAAPQQKGKY